MARPRKKAESSSNGAEELKCPECGKTFERPAALGAHRRRAHGVAGASSRTTGQRRARRSQQRRTAMSTDGRRRSTARRRGGDQQAVDRDALLQQLFPGGIPARESVIERVNSWLDEAEKLAALK